MIPNLLNAQIAGREHSRDGPVHGEAAGRGGGAGARGGVRGSRGDGGGSLPGGWAGGRRPRRSRHLPQCRRTQARRHRGSQV